MYLHDMQDLRSISISFCIRGIAEMPYNTAVVEVAHVWVPIFMLAYAKTLIHTNDSRRASVQCTRVIKIIMFRHTWNV